MPRIAALKVRAKESVRVLVAGDRFFPNDLQGLFRKEKAPEPITDKPTRIVFPTGVWRVRAVTLSDVVADAYRQHDQREKIITVG